MKNIAVCIKQVPDTQDIKWSKENNIVRDSMLSILNRADEFALHLAIKLKKQTGARVVAFSMGPDCACEILNFALACGVDDAILLSDRAFAGSDTLATGKTLSCAIKNEGDFDLILTGQYALDGDTAQTGPTMSNFLDVEYLCKVSDVDFKDGKLVVKQEFEDGYRVYEAKTPILLCALNENFRLQNPKINDYISAQDKKIKICTANDIFINPDETGIAGSPTFVSKVFRKQIERKPIFVEFSVENFLEKVDELKNGQ